MTLDTTSTPAWIQLGNATSLGTGILTINATGGNFDRGLGSSTALTSGSGVANNLVIDGNALKLNATASYSTWSDGSAANLDPNNDGVTNGVAWVLGAAGPGTNALSLLRRTREDRTIYPSHDSWFRKRC
ncbi:MAG: hypothetical protein WCP35_00370 [Verrucomicrobiota bacterium]